MLVMYRKQKLQRQNKTGNRESPIGNEPVKSKSPSLQDGKRVSSNAVRSADRPNQLEATGTANQLLQ